VLVIVPTYNEADNIRPILTRVRAAAPEAHVLVADGATVPSATTSRRLEAGSRT
jgi:glycosyltransferase involved in cell wall biosynthesis